MGMSLFGGVFNLGLRDARLPQPDVVAHGSVQQRSLLADHADMVAQTIEVHIRQILSIDGNRSAFGRVKAQDQVHQRRFSSPRWPNQSDPLARRDGQRDLIQTAAIFAVVVAHIRNFYRAMIQYKIRRIWVLGNGKRLAQRSQGLAY